MKVFSVFGVSSSGKTTTIEEIIKELKARRYSVGSIKEIHSESFAIDESGSNTDKHRKAGAEVVTARGFYETDILFPQKLSIDKILESYQQDFVVMEGVTDYNLPKIITAKSEAEIAERIDDTVFAIAGRISSSLKDYQGIPVINPLENIRELVDLIEEKVYPRLPDFPAECCNRCGYSCRELGVAILKGKETRDKCVLCNHDIRLLIDNREIEMVPFVQKILKNAILGVVKELEGYNSEGEIKIIYNQHKL